MYIFKSQGEVKTTESDLRFLKRMSLWMSAYFLSQKTMSRLGRHSPALNIKFSFAERDFFHIPYATLGLKSGGILNIYPMDNVELAFAPETPFAHLMDELANWYFFHRSGWLPDYITQGFDDQNDATTALLERGPKNLSFDYKKQIRDHAKSMSGLGPEFLAGYDLTGPVLPTDNKGISFGASGAESCSALQDGDQLLLDEEDSPLEEPYLGVESDFSSEDAPDFFNKTLLDDSSVASAEYNSFSFYDHSSGFSDKALQDLKSLDHVALRKSAFVLVQPASMMMDEVKHLNFLCRKLKEGVDWKTLMMQSSAQEKEILSIFSAHLKASWSRRGFGELSDRDLTHIGSLFYAVPFALENKQEDWQSILHIIEKDISQIVRNAGGHTDDLLSIISKTSCQLWNTSFVTTRSELLEKIISASLPSADPKTYEKDIEKLKAHSRNHVERLQKSRCLPLVSEKYLRLSENDESQEDKGSEAINIKDNGQISLLRSFFPLLKEASKAGSLFVVGDLGVGKSASLVRLAQTLEARGAPVVFLNIDRFTTLRHKKDFKKKLELENYIIDILKAWPKEEKGYLIIDGLDATRGCVSENIFCSFLEDAQYYLEDSWNIIASIRTFDLRNSHKFHAIMHGVPPYASFSLPSLKGLRHFCIPYLKREELQAICMENKDLARTLNSIHHEARGLFTNFFQLALLCNFVDQENTYFLNKKSEITSGLLLKHYFDKKLDTGKHERAVQNIVLKMIEKIEIAVSYKENKSPELGYLLDKGLFTLIDDDLSFSHHIFLDYACSRYYLQTERRPEDVLEKMHGRPDRLFVLGPAFHFALEHLWHQDKKGRPRSWELFSSFYQNENADPLLASLILASYMRFVQTPQDVKGLCQLMKRVTKASQGQILSYLARYLYVHGEKTMELNPPRALAWGHAALEASKTKNPHLLDATYMFLLALSRQRDFSGMDPEFLKIFNEASRRVLALAWEQKNANIAKESVSFICRSFGADPKKSQATLEKIFLEPHFTEHGYAEALAIIKGILYIAPHSPEFILEIVTKIFKKDSVVKTKRKNRASVRVAYDEVVVPELDFSLARSKLSYVLPFLYQHSVALGVEVSAIAILEYYRSGLNQGEMETSYYIRDMDLRIVNDEPFPRDWRHEDLYQGSREELLMPTLDFLRAASSSQLMNFIDALGNSEGPASIWSRLLGTLAERDKLATFLSSELKDLLWDIVSSLSFLSISGLCRDAVMYLGAIYQDTPLPKRKILEDKILSWSQKTTNRESWENEILRRFLYEIPADLLQNETLKEKQSRFLFKGVLHNDALSSIDFDFSDGDDGRNTQSGIDMEIEPNKSINEARQGLNDRGRELLLTRTSTKLEKFWHSIKALRLLLDMSSGHSEAHPAVLLDAWGQLAISMEQLARTIWEKPDLLPASLDENEVTAMLKGLTFNMRSEVLKLSAHEESTWQSSDIRVFIATGIMWLAPRHADDPDYARVLENLVMDPHPDVRLQVVIMLMQVWETNPDLVWHIASTVAQSENNLELLSNFIEKVLEPLSWEDVTRCEDKVESIMNREPGFYKEIKNSTFCEAMASLVSHLWLDLDSERSQERLLRWTRNVKRGEAYVGYFLFNLQSVLFYKYVDDPSSEDIKKHEKALEAMESIVQTASEALKIHLALLEGNMVRSGLYEEAHNICRIATHSLDTACKRLYFGSRSFKDRDDELGLKDNDAKKEFLKDFSQIITKIGKYSLPHTKYYLLELLDFLLPGDPDLVFQHIAGIAIKSSPDGSFYKEKMAIDALVRILRRYIADHRDVFANPERKKQLKDILERFSREGWPEALDLLYDLPSIIG